MEHKRLVYGLKKSAFLIKKLSISRLFMTKTNAHKTQIHSKQLSDNTLHLHTFSGIIFAHEDLISE